MIWGDAMRLDLGAPDAATQQDGLQPALLDRDPAADPDDRGAAEPRDLGGDGAARDRRPAARRARHAGIRLPERARPARLRGGACSARSTRLCSCRGPRVDSALSGCARTGPAASEDESAVVRRGFRAPTQVAGALAGADARREPGAGSDGAGGDGQARRRARRGAVAPRSSTRFAELLARSGGAMSVTELPGAMLAPAKLNLCLYVGPKRDDGLHEIRSLFEPLELADELKLTEARGGRGGLRGHRGPGPDREGARRAAGARLGRAASADRGHQAGAGGGGSGRRERRCRRGAAPRPRARWRGCGRSPPGSARTSPRSSSRAPCLVAGAGEVIEPVPPPGEHGGRPDPAGRGPGDGRGLRRGRPARHAAGRVRARGDPPPPARRGR